MTEFVLTLPVQFILQRGKRMTNAKPVPAVVMETDGIASGGS